MSRRKGHSMSTETIVAEMRKQAFGLRNSARNLRMNAPPDAGGYFSTAQEYDDRATLLESYADEFDKARSSETERQGVDWRALYRFERAMRFMDNKAALTRDDAYRMADEDIAGMEFHARQTGESPDRTDAAAQRQEQEGTNNV